MNTDLCCARCGRGRPSVYYFRAPGLCVDCFQRLAIGERQAIESHHPLQPWQLADISQGVETPLQRLGLAVLALALGAIALLAHWYLQAAAMALVVAGCGWREYRSRRHVTA